MARKGENIRKRKDGRWEGRYYAHHAIGNSGMRSVYAHSYSQVKEKLFLAKLSSREEQVDEAPGKESLPFCTVANQWLDTILHTKKRATYIKYLTVYTKYLAQSLLNICIDEIDETLINEKVFSIKENWSDSLKRSVYTVLGQILKYAAAEYQEQNIILERKLERKREKIEILNHSEQARLLHYLYENMDIRHLGILLCLSTGLRLGEICSLKWNDIDPKVKVLHVRATVQRLAVEGQSTKTLLLETAPKSKCSEREIPLSDTMLMLLSKYSNNSKYLLNRDKPMDPRTYQYIWKSCLKKAGIEDKKFHVLRHTFATNCINNGADVKSLSEILGHADVQTTLNRYVHPTLEVKRKYMNSLSDAYLDYAKL